MHKIRKKTKEIVLNASPTIDVRNKKTMKCRKYFFFFHHILSIPVTIVNLLQMIRSILINEVKQAKIACYKILENSSLSLNINNFFQN